MKRLVIFLAIIFGMIASSSAQTAKQKVAIYVTGDAESGYKKVIGSKLVTGITRSEGYSAVERTADFLAELTKEQDYQMSGAVSDNQIARLGQQFGVRYVLVADISEVFESMFISARMIDVQTAQITNSTEASQVISGMENLTSLAEKIVIGLLGKAKSASVTLVAGPFTTFLDFEKFVIPEGFHIATKDEINDLYKDRQLIGKNLSFPIYTNVNITQESYMEPYTVHVYFHKSKKWEYTRSSRRHRECRINRLQGICLKSMSEHSVIDLSYIDDLGYSLSNKVYNRVDGANKYVTGDDFRDRSTAPPKISPGYIYLIKNK